MSKGLRNLIVVVVGILVVPVPFLVLGEVASYALGSLVIPFTVAYFVASGPLRVRVGKKGVALCALLTWILLSCLLAVMGEPHGVKQVLLMALLVPVLVSGSLLVVANRFAFLRASAEPARESARNGGLA